MATGLCGPRGAAGVMMPSLDRVGRRFPFAIAWETDLPPLAANFALQPVVERLEAAALAMIEDGATREELDTSLAALPHPALMPRDLPCEPGSNLGSLWVAGAIDATRVMAVSDLPRGPAQSAALFDPVASYWTQAPSESCEV